MSDSLDAFWHLLTVRIHKCGTLFALVDSSKASRLELRPPRPGEHLTWQDKDKAVNFMRQAATAGGFLALITNGRSSEGHEPEPLPEVEVRFFMPQQDPANHRLQLTQASRLHASVVLTRLQMRGMMSAELTPTGPHRGYQQLHLPGPFY